MIQVENRVYFRFYYGSQREKEREIFYFLILSLTQNSNQLQWSSRMGTYEQNSIRRWVGVRAYAYALLESGAKNNFLRAQLNLSMHLLDIRKKENKKVRIFNSSNPKVIKDEIWRISRGNWKGAGSSGRLKRQERGSDWVRSWRRCMRLYAHTYAFCKSTFTLELAGSNNKHWWGQLRKHEKCRLSTITNV